MKKTRDTGAGVQMHSAGASQHRTNHKRPSNRPAHTSHLAGSPTDQKLLSRLREALQSRHYSRRTERTYVMWVKRYVFFFDKRHPDEMAEPEINAFLTHLAVQKRVSASTRTQALSALLFLYRHVLGREVGDLFWSGTERAIKIELPCCRPLLKKRCGATLWRLKRFNSRI
jgi:hypothetical protein